MMRRLNDERVSVSEVEATVGGGSLPRQVLPSWAVAISAQDPDEVARRLRLGTPGVFGRIEDQHVLINLRCVLPEQDDELLTAVQAILRAN